MLFRSLINYIGKSDVNCLSLDRRQAKVRLFTSRVLIFVIMAYFFRIVFLIDHSICLICSMSWNSLFASVYRRDSKDFGWVPLKDQPVLKQIKFNI